MNDKAALTAIGASVTAAGASPWLEPVNRWLETGSYLVSIIAGAIGAGYYVWKYFKERE